MLDAIWRAPLFDWPRTAPGGVDLVAKIEWYGPTGSLKGRIHAHIIARAGVVTHHEESLDRARRLTREEGGCSAASPGRCNVAASLNVAAAHPQLRSIVTVIPDTGQRYFTTPMFGEEEYPDIPERKTLDPRSIAELDRHAARLEVIG
jgi:cysteine synthase